MTNLILFLKGIIIGIGKIIPGLSGAIIMMILGLYEKGIKAISNFFDDIIENAKFLFIVGSGIIVSVILMSKLIQLVLNDYYFIVICFFVGLILGGIPPIFKEIESTNTKSNVIIFILFFVLMILLSLVDNNYQITFTNSAFLMFIIGIIEAATMIIPGLSGTAVLMALGLYHVLLNMFSNLSNFSLIVDNLRTIIPFGFGILIGGLFFIKLMDYLLTNYKIKTYWAITAFALSSVALMFIKALETNYCLSDVIIGSILLVIGYKGSRFLDMKFSK